MKMAVAADGGTPAHRCLAGMASVRVDLLLQRPHHGLQLRCGLGMTKARQLLLVAQLQGE